MAFYLVSRQSFRPDILPAVLLIFEFTMMVATLREMPMKAMFEDEEQWLYYTDIYLHYQFRYPACFTAARWGSDVNLTFDPNWQGDPAPSFWPECRFYILKPQPFHDNIDLEEYLMFQDRLRGVPSSKDHSLLTDLQPGYRGIRVITGRPDGMIASDILVSYQSWLLPMHAVIRDGVDLDIKLARSVRFF